MPVPVTPTDTPLATAFAPFTAVGFGAVVLMRASLLDVGTTPVFQFPAVNQSVDAAPVQSVAAAGTDKATPTSAAEPIANARWLEFAR